MVKLEQAIEICLGDSDDTIVSTAGKLLHRVESQRKSAKLFGYEGVSHRGWGAEIAWVAAQVGNKHSQAQL
eukprot:2398458-Amphidinium_carterae.2